MSQKRGQLTIFIILGIIILFSIFWFVQTQKAAKPQIAPVRSSLEQSIASYVEECMRLTAIQGALYLGLHGGYYDAVPEHVLEDYPVPYYLFDGRNFVPSSEQLGSQFENYVREELPFCVQRFDVFQNQAGVKMGEMQPRVIIEPNQVIVNLNFPVEVVSEGMSASMNEFSVRVPLRLGHIHSQISKITSKSDGICLSCISSSMQSAGLHVDIDRVSDDSFIFIVSDKQSVIEGEPYRYVFAAKYALVLSEERGLLSAIPNQKAFVGEHFTLSINSNAPAFNFTVTPLFTISQTGVIDFIPKSGDVGEHLIRVEAKNSAGESDWRLFVLNISERAK